VRVRERARRQGRARKGATRGSPPWRMKYQPGVVIFYGGYSSWTTCSPLILERVEQMTRRLKTDMRRTQAWGEET